MEICNASLGSVSGTALNLITSVAKSRHSWVIASKRRFSMAARRSCAAEGSPPPHSSSNKLRDHDFQSARSKNPPVTRQLLLGSNGGIFQEATSYVSHNRSFDICSIHCRIVPQGRESGNKGYFSRITLEVTGSRRTTLISKVMSGGCSGSGPSGMAPNHRMPFH